MKTSVLKAAMSIAVMLGISMPLVAQTTVTFQQGVGGYTSCFDRLISLTNSSNGADVDTTSSSFFIDGDPNDASRADYLIRFDNILGGSGIPANAHIVSAELTLRTTSETVNSNSRSGESYNVYRLQQAFDSSSILDGDFGDGDFLFTPFVDGVEPEDGEADWIMGTFDHPIGEAGLEPDLFYSADVTRAVQSWVDGDTNFGIAVCSDHTDNDDGWSVHSTGSSDLASRPQLTVTYVIDPTIQVFELQNGLGGFMGTTDVFLRESDVSIDGSTVSEQFLDGSDGGSSFDDPYMIKFDLSSLPPIDEILSAELVFMTGISSGASDSPGAFTLHQLNVPFTTSSQYGDFSGDVAAMETAGEIGAAAASFVEIDEAELMKVDVKPILENWLVNGQPNHGFYIGANGTSNGWQIFSSGAIDQDLAPMLRITLREIDFVQGDMNGDGVLNTLDISAFVLAILNRPSYEMMFPSVDADRVGDYNGDGILNTLDISGFVANF